MALCLWNESAKTEPWRIANGSLRSRKLYPERGAERERCHFSVIPFPYGFLRMSFLDSISKDSIVSSTISSFPYHSAHQPLPLPIWFHNDSNFQHCLAWGKNHSEHWIDLTTPAHPRTIRESLSQSNSMATTSRQDRQEWQCQRGWKYSKHYHYQCTENRA